MKKLLIYICCTILVACKQGEIDEPAVKPIIPKPTDSTYKPTPYKIVLPKVSKGGFYKGWNSMLIPEDNPLTEEGIALGKKLFYDKILSSTNTIACASCHKQEKAFTDDKQFSEGVNGQLGNRNSMPLFNLAWAEKIIQTPHRFFWDGRKSSLEDQVLAPIADPVEMNQSLPELITELRNHTEYPLLFKKAFGTDSILMKHVMYAIAQFERTLISGNSKFDKYLRNEANLTPQEERGVQVYMDSTKGDCFHCHVVSPYFTDFSMKNNGLDSLVEGTGLGAITGNPLHMGLFKTPSLRNLSFTAPYMHDGRFQTLEQVVEFYNSGTKDSKTTDEFIRKHFKDGGLNLTQADKEDLVAFLRTLDDYEFITDPKFK